ncbi:MAG TPA: ADP-glyceromanno-heptose 6-epimerase [Steroidobacteraceae bacterium]|jgi:ADP-L-glycero-D-manno-heptose 6-epimerase|nr:ADP-glyceromanno-heptose 6-epimerase [Steroidobacteraceae bacterium]
MYLITGGAGFIGSNLAAALAQRGDAVVVCDWLGRDERWRNLAAHELADLIVPEALPAWLARSGSQLSAVVHLGAISSTTESDVDLIVRHNVRATLNLLQWCTERQVRLIHASSAATYGDGSAGFDDDGGCEALARLRPLNAYGWSKHLVDRRIARLAQTGQPLPPQWVGLKFFNVYGPNEYHKGTMRSVVAQNFARVRAGEPLRLFRSYRSEYADGGQLRDFIYVTDCVEVILWLLAQPQVSGLFNVGTGTARSWLDLAAALFSASGRPRAIEFIDMPPELRGKYQYFTEARMQRLRAAGYTRAFTSLETGVTDYVQRFLAADDPYR